MGICTTSNFLPKTVFERRNAAWQRELPSVIKKYVNTIHKSTKMSLTETSTKVTKNWYFPILKRKENRGYLDIN